MISKRNSLSESDRRGGAGAAGLLVEGKKELAKLLVGDQVRRRAGEQRQLLEVAQLVLLGGGCQAAQLHALGHPLA